MEKLNRHASRAYLQCAQAAIHSGLSSWEIFAEMMRFLINSSEPDDPCWVYAKRVLALQSDAEDDGWSFECNANGEFTNEHEKELTNGTARDRNMVLFLAATVPALAKWLFHPFDDDFHPSIPHGHWQGNANPKLDVYLGWVYQKSKQVRREPRKNIIALWNDTSFRRFAKKSIEYYVDHHPHYSGWKMKNPMRLPRRR